ncbi:MAG: GAF domain-containing SpoIIE family protein phosphatase, partial [Phycisphaerae bacterium]
YSLVATGEETIRFSAKLGIAGQAFQTQSMVNVRDAYADDRFNPAIDKQTGYRTRNLLTFPMAGHNGDIVGVLQALNKHQGPFDTEDEERAEALGQLAGIGIQRQMLLDEYARKQQLERDLSIARDIQQRLLPKADPKIDGYEIAGWNKPADETGGDCYDYVHLSDGRLGILMADVTGHGIGPALIAAECRALVRALASVSSQPSTILGRANELLYDDLDSGRFVTTFLGALDPTRHVVEFISAGHGPIIHYDRGKGAFREFAATTYPMGIVAQIERTPAAPVALAAGDMLILITDGFFEWANPDGEQFGTSRLTAVIHKYRDEPASQIIARMHTAVMAFGSQTKQADDLTAVIVKRL